MALESILATVVLPAALDLLKGVGGALSRRFFGLSVDDQIKLDMASVEKLKALSELDNPYGTPSQWIVDLRASFRYVAAGVLILSGVGLVAMGGYQWANHINEVGVLSAANLIEIGVETAGTPFFFIFGERMWQGFKGLGK